MAGSHAFVIRDPIYGTGSITAITTVSGSVTVDAKSQSVLVWTTQVAWIQVGAAATRGSLPIPANTPTVIPIPSTLQTGSPISINARTETTSGSMFAIGLAE